MHTVGRLGGCPSSPHRCVDTKAPYAGQLNGADTLALTEDVHMAKYRKRCWPKDVCNGNNNMLAACMPHFGRG